jgi:hypothetical protein
MEALYLWFTEFFCPVWVLHTCCFIGREGLHVGPTWALRERRCVVDIATDPTVGAQYRWSALYAPRVMSPAFWSLLQGMNLTTGTQVPELTFVQDG